MTKRNIKHTAAEFAVREMTINGNVEKCVNLRHAEISGTDALTVAPQPKMVCDHPLTPLVRLPATNEWLFYSNTDAEGNSELYVGQGNSEPEWILQVAGEPRCAVPTATGAVIMLPDGPVTINRKGTLWVADKSELHGTAPVVITAVPKGTLTKTTSPISLEINTSGQSALPNNSSLTKLQTVLNTAYSALSTEALAGGVWIQPVGVRCRVLDNSGNELWRSPMSIVGADGWQCTAGINGTLSGSGSSFTTSALHIAAKSFAINVQIGDMSEIKAWSDRASVAVIEATPQLHPIIPDRMPRTIISAITGNTPQISVWMPGIQPDENANLTTHKARLQAAAMSADSLMTRIGRIDLASGARTVQLVPTAAMSVNDELKALDNATGNIRDNTFQPDDNPLSQIIASSQPFSAGCVVQNGDTTVWGNISAVQSSHAHPFPSIAATMQGAWQAALRIHVNGSNYVTRYSGDDRCPTALSPIVFIEHAHATAATLYVQQLNNGTIVQADLELSPMPNGLMSCHISPGLKPIPLTQSELDELPAATALAGATKVMQGSVLVATSAEPTRALCGGICSQGEIKALATAVKSQSSWDFSKCHIYAFAGDGIYTVSAATHTLRVSATRIDTREVLDARAVTPTPNGVVAIAGNKPVICTASSVKPMPMPPKQSLYDLRQVAWHSGNDELYFTDTQGNILVLNGDGWHNILVPERVERVCETAKRIWLTCSDSSWATGDAAVCHAEWQCDIPCRLPTKTADITIPISASHFSGSIEIRAHNGAGSAHSMPITALNINGEINAPIHARLLAPWRCCMLMRINARVSADFTAYSPIVTITRPALR